MIYCKKKQTRIYLGRLRDNKQVWEGDAYFDLTTGIAEVVGDDHATHEYYINEYWDRTDNSSDISKSFKARGRGKRVFKAIKVLMGDRPDLFICEFGCGNGFNLTYLKHRLLNGQHRFVGIEPNQKARNYCRSNGLEVYSSLDELINNIGDQRLDVIFSSHVFEHIDDLEPILIKLRGLLAQDAGALFVEVPSFYGTKSLGFHHVKCFTRSGLQNLLCRSGFANLNHKAFHVRDFFSNYIFEAFMLSDTSELMQKHENYELFIQLSSFSLAINRIVTKVKKKIDRYGITVLYICTKILSSLHKKPK